MTIKLKKLKSTIKFTKIITIKNDNVSRGTFCEE